VTIGWVEDVIIAANRAVLMADIINVSQTIQGSDPIGGIHMAIWEQSETARCYQRRHGYPSNESVDVSTWRLR